MEKQRPRMWRDTHALNRLDVLSLSYYRLYKLMRRRAVYHDQAIRYFQQLHYRRYGILFETLEIYSSAKLALTGGFKGGGQGGPWPPQDARGNEVTLSTKDFSVQFYTKCAV